jgi:hypothetical protein
MSVSIPDDIFVSAERLANHDPPAARRISEFIANRLPEK